MLKKIKSAWEDLGISSESHRGPMKLDERSHMENLFYTETLQKASSQFTGNKIIKENIMSMDNIYSRKEAIEDGFLVDITARYPDIAAIYRTNVCVTDRVWEIVEKSADNCKTASSREGILRDILWMSTQMLNPLTLTFPVSINGIEGQEQFTFKLAMGFEGNEEVVATILLPAEDTHDRPRLF